MFVWTRYASGQASKGPTKRRGRKVSVEFEEAVADDPIYTSLQKVDNEEKAVVVAHVSYNYDTIRAAAAEVMMLSAVRNKERLQKLQYKRPWCENYFMSNHGTSAA